MKKFLGIVLLGIGVLSFGASIQEVAHGKAIFKRCAVCHGEGAEKIFAGVPPLKSIPSEERIQYMREYSEGKRNAYNNGALMKFNLRGLREKDFQALESYIDSL